MKPLAIWWTYRIQGVISTEVFWFNRHKAGVLNDYFHELFKLFLSGAIKANWIVDSFLFEAPDPKVVVRRCDNVCASHPFGRKNAKNCIIVSFQPFDVFLFWSTKNRLTGISFSTFSLRFFSFSPSPCKDEETKLLTGRVFVSSSDYIFFEILTSI